MLKEICNYDEIPNEILWIVEQMTGTQLLDMDMQKIAFSRHLLLSLESV